MGNIENVQLQLASDFVQFTDKNIFLTGKAGTGKTTFLHNLKNKLPKRLVVVAPTGVAAINAGGVTIHSFFQLPFGPIIPRGKNPKMDRNDESKFRFSRDKVNIIKSLDLLVIDEISMVRADVLDAIDEVLKRFRNKAKPFGGVQLLMIGDLQQLAPVVKDDEWILLREHYESIYFFNSIALKQAQFVPIELKHIYRQQDQKFIDILNKVREKRLDPETLEALNKRYIPNFQMPADEQFITLTTHNNQANSINSAKLNAINEKVYSFTASTSGEFPEYSYPTDKNLDLKVGAQVMFVKNDTSKDKLYYNGKIGTVVEVDKDSLQVLCPGDDEPIKVLKVQWSNYKYSIDPDTDEIKEEVLGTFEQIPLKLAWAITIHKSQGLTFERALIDAQSAFASGQVYVALSRCKTLEGMVLNSPISMSSIKTDTAIDVFNRNVEANPPSAEILEKCKKEFQQNLLFDLFSFEVIGRNLANCYKIVNEQKQTVGKVLVDSLLVINGDFMREIKDVSVKFIAQLQALSNAADNVEKSEELQGRVRSGAKYFTDKMEDIVGKKLNGIPVDIDNKEVRKTFDEAFARLENEVMLKIAFLNAVKDGFSVTDYMHKKAIALIEKPVKKNSNDRKANSSPVNVDNPQLYQALKNWRNLKAEELNVPHFQIISQKTLYELIEKLPTSMKMLASVKGIGPSKIRTFGAELIDLIADYCDNEGIKYEKSYEFEIKEKQVKGDSIAITLSLLNEGLSIVDIAKERGLAKSTIESHIFQLIGKGDLAVEKVISEEKVKCLTDYFDYDNREKTLSEIYADFNGKFTYSEIRMVLVSVNNG